MKTTTNIKDEIGDIMFSYFTKRDFELFKKEITSYVENFKENFLNNELNLFILNNLLKDCGEMNDSNIKPTVGKILSTLTALTEIE
nr:hypothetical protein [uncultured Fluviicola sp.]